MRRRTGGRESLLRLVPLRSFTRPKIQGVSSRHVVEQLPDSNLTAAANLATVDRV